MTHDPSEIILIINAYLMLKKHLLLAMLKIVVLLNVFFVTKKIFFSHLIHLMFSLLNNINLNLISVAIGFSLQIIFVHILNRNIVAYIAVNTF